MTGKAYVGVGGWTYEPWRDNFYPKGLPQARELEYAATHVTAIEINGTYYRLQGADSFANFHNWNDWTDIPEALPLAILARPGFSMRALESPAALRYLGHRIPSPEARELPDTPPPSWCFIPMPLRPESSTAIRERQEKSRRK